ncbi:sugar ABC transporter permease [Actinomycetaceae bacterium MB13-C1-2]|nr:sugar ABC transporter permease [Actinomycetaceae bacterium MB13-C1-2]
MRLSDKKYALLLMVPAALFILVFMAWPLFRLIYDSFFEISKFAGGPRDFIGLANYQEALGKASFRSAAGRTVIYTVFVVTLEFTLGFLAALLFSVLGKKSSVFRTFFLYPLMIAPVVAGLLWRFLLIDNSGIVNHLLAKVGIISSPDSINWLSNPRIVLFSVAIPDIWLTTSFMTLVLFAGLQNVPAELVEAARLDGAGFPRILRSIVIPDLRPVIAVALLIRGIDAAKAFDIIQIQTGGGPQNASETMSLLVYQTMIRHGEPGLASAMGTLYLIAMMVVAALAVVFLWKPGANS